MSSEKDLQKKVDYLENQVSMLKSRVQHLEKQLGAGESTAGTPASPPRGGAGKDKSKLKDRLTPESYSGDLSLKENIEQLIGGKILNRAGIVIILFAAAYFLKYAFDHQWISETGRLIIGFIAGASLLAAGDVAMNKKYNYFSQGLTGGGIGIIYLSAYAAVNFYHLLSPAVVFGIMVLTALAGVLLSIRHNAFSIAVLSTIGGFMAPFLIGSSDSSPAVLLSYITILDIVVLCLAYFKNWRSLNYLAFAGTVLAYLAYYIFSGWDHALLNQVYLVIFFAIFGTLAFIYNVRHHMPTKIQDISLMLANTAFFALASTGNLNDYPEWHGLFLVVLAAAYLAVSLALNRRRLGDELLFLAMLGTGLALVTVAVPVQLEEWSMGTAWLVESLVLVYSGFRARNVLVRRAGVLLFLVASALHFPFAAWDQPLLNLYSLNSFLAIAGAFFTCYIFYQYLPQESRHQGALAAAIYGIILTLKQVSWEVINAINYYSPGFETDFILSLSWLAVATVVMAAGMIKNLKNIRLVSLVLFGITVIKIFLYDLSNIDIIFRVLLLLAAGVLLVAVSFLYQRQEKRDQDA